MARAIIHNSNYASKDEAKAAIDRYFDERNEHFRLKPKRAGNRIWGRERHTAAFPISTTAKIHSIDDEARPAGQAWPLANDHTMAVGAGDCFAKSHFSMRNRNP